MDFWRWSFYTFRLHGDFGGFWNIQVLANICRSCRPGTFFSGNRWDFQRKFRRRSTPCGSLQTPSAPAQVGTCRISFSFWLRVRRFLSRPSWSCLPASWKWSTLISKNRKFTQLRSAFCTAKTHFILSPLGVNGRFIENSWFIGQDFYTKTYKTKFHLKTGVVVMLTEDCLQYLLVYDDPPDIPAIPAGLAGC